MSDLVLRGDLRSGDLWVSGYTSVYFVLGWTRKSATANDRPKRRHNPKYGDDFSVLFVLSTSADGDGSITLDKIILYDRALLIETQIVRTSTERFEESP